jgi:hypothetical protein
MRTGKMKRHANEHVHKMIKIIPELVDKRIILT